MDLRPTFDKWGLAGRSQGKRGTCSVFTMAGALEFAAAKEQNHGERLSIEFLNWSANKVVGQDVDGGFFSDLWRGFTAHGICSEQAMPYQKRFDAAVRPTSEALSEARARLGLRLQPHWIKEWDVKNGLTGEQLKAIKRTLSQGWPVCAGLRWPKRVEWRKRVLQMCPAEEVFDGHSVLLVGYRDEAAQPGGGTFIFRNSGGGEREAYMPYAYAERFMNDAVWVSCPPASKPMP